MARSNINAIDSVFEISPFTSFGELFDLEDFLVRNSGIKKYKQLREYNTRALNAFKSVTEREKHLKQAKTVENLILHKIHEIRQEIDSLVRNFNLAGYASPTAHEAPQDIAVFAPTVAQMEDVILILNPMYNYEYVDAAFELLLRSGFSILKHQFVEADEALVEALFLEKYGTEYEECFKLYHRLLGCNGLHVFHLAKVAADRECREAFIQSSLVLSDLYTDRQLKQPLQPPDMPYLFFFLDLESTYESGLKILYEPELTHFTGSDFNLRFDSQQAIKVL